MLDDRSGLDPLELEHLTSVVASQKTLEDVVRWSLGLTPPRIVCAVIVQDEYTHDVVIPYDGKRWLVYDTT